MVTLKIEGMKCGHCQKKVKKALEGVAAGVTANVDLEAKTATVEGCDDKEVLKKAVEAAGFAVVA